MKRLKKGAYLLLTIGMGIIYLTFVDDWQVYAESLEKFNSLYQDAPYQQSWQQAFPGQVLAQGEPGQDGSGSELTDGENDGGGEEDAGRGALLGDDRTEDTGTDDTSMTGSDETAPYTGDGFGDGGEPVYMTVEDDYFSDAVFIGDSRTVGLHEYGGLEDITTFYASTGLTVYKIFDAEIVEVPGQRKKQTIEEALEQNEYKKIYLMIGINEMGTGTVETFTARYKEVVDHLLELQPDAILYIQGILKVSTERSNQGDYINNEGIEARNEALSQLADNRRIFYLDANPLVCDETGGMVSSYTFDGVHLKAQYIDIWKDYLKSHAIQLNQTQDGQLSLDESFI